MTSPRGLFIIAANAVPLVGVLFFGWAIGTILALFWAETLVFGTANVVRIYAHRRLAKSSVHPDSYLLSYATVLYPFSVAHGIFLFAMLAMLSQHRPAAAASWWVDLGAFRTAVIITALLAVAELLFDLITLATKPFVWLRKRIDRSVAHIAIFHLGLLGGAVLLSQFETPVSFLPVIVILKTAFDLGEAIPKRPLTLEPPRWFRNLAKKMNKDVDKEWEEFLAVEAQQTETDEEAKR